MLGHLPSGLRRFFFVFPTTMTFFGRLALICSSVAESVHYFNPIGSLIEAPVPFGLLAPFTSLLCPPPSFSHMEVSETLTAHMIRGIQQLCPHLRLFSTDAPDFVLRSRTTLHLGRPLRSS